MTTLLTQNPTIKRILHDPTRGRVILISASGIDIYRISDWTRVAWATLANATCGAINDNGIYIGTSDSGVWRLPLSATGAATAKLTRAFRPGAAVELSSESILDLAGADGALAIVSAGELFFLPSPVVGYEYTGGGTPTACAVNGTQLAYGTDAGSYLTAHPTADWSTVSPITTAGGGSTGYALEMDGVGDYVSVPDAAALRFGTQDFKITARVRLRSGYDAGTWPPVVSKGYTIASDWMFYCSAGYWKFHGDNGAMSIGTIETSPITVEVWTEIEVERVGDNGYLRIDGEVVDSITGVDSADFNNTKDICLGSYNEGVDRFFEGDIDYVIIEVGGSEVANWQINEGEGTTVADSVGSNHGSTVGTPDWIAAGEGGGEAEAIISQVLEWGEDLFMGTDDGLYCHDGETTTDLTAMLGTIKDVRVICPSPEATASSGRLAYGTADDIDGGQFGIIDLPGTEMTTTAGDVTGAVWVDDTPTVAIIENQLVRYRLVAEISPAAAARDVRRDWALYAEITDSLGGIQSGTVALKVNGVSKTPTTAAITDGYAVAFTPGSNSGYGERVSIEISGTDADGNTVSRTWTFTTASAPALTVTDTSPPNVTCIRDIDLASAEADETVDSVNVIWIDTITSPLIVTEAQAKEVGRVAIDGQTYHRHQVGVKVLATDSGALQTRDLRQGSIATITCDALGMSAQKCEILAAQRAIDDGAEDISFNLQAAYYEEV